VSGGRRCIGPGRRQWQRGFSKDQGSRQAHFPTHLLAGDGPRLVRRNHRPGERQQGRLLPLSRRHKGSMREQDTRPPNARRKVIRRAVQEQISDPEHIACVPRGVEQEIAKLRSDLPDTRKLKEAELTAEQRRFANFVDFIGEGRGNQALAKALVETEPRLDQRQGSGCCTRRLRLLLDWKAAAWVQEIGCNGRRQSAAARGAGGRGSVAALPAGSPTAGRS